MKHPTCLIAALFVAGTCVAATEQTCDQQLQNAQDVAVDPEQRLQNARAALTCFHTVSFEQANAGESRISELPIAKIKAANDAEADAKSAIDFEGKLGFGIGVGYSWGRGMERVEDAEVVNGIVRVKHTATDKPRIFLEAHKFLKVWHRTTDIGIGPFISIQTGGDDALSSWGAGLMFGFRENARDGEDTTSWNLGVGVLWDADVKGLGDGIHANEALPEGETEIRYKNTSAESLFVVFSRRF